MHHIVMETRMRGVRKVDHSHVHQWWCVSVHVTVVCCADRVVVTANGKGTTTLTETVVLIHTVDVTGSERPMAVADAGHTALFNLVNPFTVTITNLTAFNNFCNTIVACVYVCARS
jgi:hypothetical protein